MSSTDTGVRQQAAAEGREPSAAELLRLHERMLLIRRTEERLSADSAAGKLPGAVHLYIGEEAVAADGRHAGTKVIYTKGPDNLTVELMEHPAQA